MEAALSGRLTSPFTQGSFGLPSRFIRIDSSNQTSHAAVSDRIDLGSAARSPLKVLNSEVLGALDEALKEEGISLDRQADPASFTPQQVADRILSVIDAALSKYAADDPQRAELLEKAREGVERAFEEARGILDGLGVLDGELADNITRTSELIQGGLERLSGGEPAVVSEAGSETTQPATAVQQVALSAASYSTSQITSLVIDTVDGDRITIDISKQASASQVGLQAQSGNTQVQGFRSSREASVTFSFNVQGELDEDEQKAVESLLKRIDKVSSNFFEGNVQKAFASASRMKLDSEELAGFALDMRSTESYRAVAAYQQTATSAEVPAADGSLQDAAGFGADVRGLFDEAVATTRFAEPARDVARLFGAMTDERALSGVAELKDEATSMLRGLVSSIVAGFSGEVDDDDHADRSEKPEHDEAKQHEKDDS